MRVTQNSINTQFLYNLGKVNEKLIDSYNQLSSGQKLVVSSDDPYAAGRVLDMQSQQRELAQYTKNANYADEISTVTYSYASTVKSAVTKAEEFATQASGIINPSEYATYAQQVNQLIESALDTANAQYNGKYIFSANATDTLPFVASRDANGQVVTTVDGFGATVPAIDYAGSAAGSSFDVGEGISVSPYSSPAQNQQIADMINHLVSLRDAMTAQDPTALKAAATSLATDEDNIIAQLSSHAAMQSRVESIQKRNTATANTLETQVSSLADADVATATVQYNAAQTAYQAALNAGAKMLKISLLDYV